MMFKKIQKKEILKEVTKNISIARHEILATMLFKDEINSPLPLSYFNLLNSRVKKGVILKRLGFGRKEDYNGVRLKHSFQSKNYEFRYIIQVEKYQRLIIIDKEKLFFGIDGLYFKSTYKPFIKLFIDYFYQNFKKGKI